MLSPKCSGSISRPDSCRDFLDPNTSRPGLLGRHRRPEPTVCEATNAGQCRWPAPAERHLEGLLIRLARSAHVVKLIVPATVAEGDRLAGPPCSEQWRHLLEEFSAVGAERTQCESLAGLIETDHEAQQKTALRQPVDLCKRLGKREGVATDGHDVGAELERRGRGGRVRQPDEGVDGRAEWNI